MNWLLTLYLDDGSERSCEYSLGQALGTLGKALEQRNLKNFRLEKASC